MRLPDDLKRANRDKRQYCQFFVSENGIGGLKIICGRKVGRAHAVSAFVHFQAATILYPILYPAEF